MIKIYFLIMACFLLLTFTKVSSQNVVNEDMENNFANGWQLIPSGVEENLLSVHFANNTHGFIGGALTRCLKSTNGGLNWAPVFVPSYADFNSVWVKSSNDALLGGWDTAYITHNNGQTWTGTYTNTMNFAINSLQFISSQNGFAFLPWVSFIKTTDGGNTWSVPTGGYTAWDFFDGFMLDQNTGWGVGDCQNIAKTTDGGETWLPYEWNFWTELTCNKIWGIQATSDLNAWAVADSGIVYRTTDGGDYWSRNIIAGEEDNLKDIYFLNANVGYIVGFNGKIFKTTDGGNTWIQEPQLTNNNLNAVFFISENLGWAVGENGTILRYWVDDTGLPDLHTAIVEDIVIYPNPVTTESAISFTLQEKQKIKIDIRDISDRVLKTIFEGTLQRGEHLISLDLPDLSKGVYLCRLSVQGESICKSFLVTR